MPESRSRHLVAPELLLGLALLPDLDLSEAMLALIRSAKPGSGAIPLPQLSPEQAAIRCEEKHIPGAEGHPQVRILVYAPATTGADRPAILHCHGGGFVMGMPEINDAMNRQIVVDQGCVIVSVDYRLAPEARWHESYEDNYAALAWLFAEAEALCIDTARVAVSGESAGGGHAAALALMARDRGDYPICFQLLDCPMLDDRTGNGDDPHPYTGEFVWTPDRNRFGWASLLGMEPGGEAIPDHAVPARATDLTGLPPTFIAIGAIDLFLEESLDYIRRLTRAGVPAELHVIPGAYHGFGAAGADAPQVKALMHYRREALTRAFAKGE